MRSQRQYRRSRDADAAKLKFGFGMQENDAAKRAAGYRMPLPSVPARFTVIANLCNLGLLTWPAFF
jgi:hypothetical protein